MKISLEFIVSDYEDALRYAKHLSRRHGTVLLKVEREVNSS